MPEDIIICFVCSFKCAKSQLYKTGGFCPRLMWKEGDHQVIISKQINEDTGAATRRPAVTKK